jgi:glycosyltransferase involved in cell wall biosynthesis
MKAAFYSSSLAVGGGGEKYFLSVVETALEADLESVLLLSPQRPDLGAWERLDLRLSRGGFRWAPATDATVMHRTAGLDLFVSMSWGLPLSLASRSVALIQFPSRDLRYPSPICRPPHLARAAKIRAQRAIVRRYDDIVCNSEYVRHHTIRQLLRTDATVIYPPVTPITTGGVKDNMILGVGRFIAMKRQDALIRAFRRLRQEVPEAQRWSLHLVGVQERTQRGRRYVKDLEALAEGLPVVLYPDAALDVLRDLYSRSSIFWHAAGFERHQDPSQQEHFGMSTAEAMASGSVPIVINLGGQPEIVTHGVNGYLWALEGELVRYTADLMNSVAKREALAAAAAQAVRRFNLTRFKGEVRTTILSLQPPDEARKA